MTPAAAPAGGLTGELTRRVLDWIDSDPDPRTRQELSDLLAAGAASELADRFGGRLRFGTAGLRGALGGGPNRINRAVVRLATAALASWLDANRPGSRQAGVVVGCDARHGSAAFYDETASVLVGAGFKVHLLEPMKPTPLLAFAVPHLGAAAGVMITASHNPPADNGYKLYLGDGAQIVPPVDAEIEELMDRVGPPAGIVAGVLSGPLVLAHGEEIEEAYVAALVAESAAPDPGSSAGRAARGLRVVYSPMHGVAGRTFLSAMERAGYPAPLVVAAQADPDPDFPTVAFPNPEEPGALDLALAEARASRADLVLANDPDGDRLAVAVPDAAADGGWRALRGDELGTLLGSYVLGRVALPDGERPLVATTVVSSTMLAEIAAAAGALFEETLTGFKWIVRAGAGRPGARLVFGYEEALGYCVGPAVRDKDGIGAALAVLGMVAEARAAGRTVTDLLDGLESEFGVHLTAQLPVPTTDPATAMAALRRSPPAEIAGRAVGSAEDLSSGSETLPPADVLVYRLAGARVVVRPSGTEPKLKVYFEVVRPAGAADLGAARSEAVDLIGELRRAMIGILSGGADDERG